MSNDELAQEMFGANYDQLSAFGKDAVRRKQGTLDPANSAVTMRDVDLIRALSAAQNKIAALERENRDLWEENEDLQLQLLENDEDSDRRSSRQRKARASSGANETVPEVSPDPWFSTGIDGAESD